MQPIRPYESSVSHNTGTMLIEIQGSYAPNTQDKQFYEKRCKCPLPFRKLMCTHYKTMTNSCG